VVRQDLRRFCQQLRAASRRHVALKPNNFMMDMSAAAEPAGAVVQMMSPAQWAHAASRGLLPTSRARSSNT
jgi:hypothetical protein